MYHITGSSKFEGEASGDVVWWWHGGLTWLWVAYGGFIVARLVTLYARQRGDHWMVLGAR